jgi:hypothetical protein
MPVGMAMVGYSVAREIGTELTDNFPHTADELHTDGIPLRSSVITCSGSKDPYAPITVMMQSCVGRLRFWVKKELKKPRASVFLNASSKALNIL